jgi:adenine-specific DNA-methyltransferase
VIILDFFAGSGTTGHAVLELNKEDNGNRKFILCTNNENNICENITYPRLQTVITGIRPDGSKYSEGIEANLKYLQTAMVNKSDDDLDELLYEASFYLAELENMSMIDDVSICIANCDEDVDDIIASATEKLKEVFIADDVLLSSQQKEFFSRHKVVVKQIPNYYYKEM